ncbi:hypothetical protein [Sphingomonas sp.]|uniref:hypothetical protein n=1 Tax=Sphingomonas sp. TaxID=28214 RepID=UPI003B00A61D
MQQDQTRIATHLAKSFLRPLRPYELVGTPRVRLGRNFDGGYIMLDRFDGVQAAYSLGINDDVSWDYDIAVRGIDIFQYDHTIEQLPFEHPRFHWKKLGISNDLVPGMATIESLIVENGHQDADNMILKCDIEGAEWLALCFTPNNVLAKFSQIVLEVHNLQLLRDQQFAHTARQVALNLTASHHVVNVHGNNFSQFEAVGGIPLPQSLELTLARKNLGEFIPSTRIFPADDDMPCNPRIAEMHLGPFVY